MKKLSTLFFLTLIAGLVSIHAYANTTVPVGFGMGDFGGFSHFGGFGYSFTGFGMGDFGGFNRFGGFGGFGHGMDYAGGFGGFGHGMDYAGGFGGFGHGMDYAGGFGGFGHGMDFTARHAGHFSGNKIVPLLPTASAANSITYDENGELHVRPFDDEDLFVED